MAPYAREKSMQWKEPKKEEKRKAYDRAKSKQLYILLKLSWFYLNYTV